jgi:trk system potassium uptake protein TrkA
MQFCVIGLGSFGSAVALTLAKSGHEVMAIDRMSSKVSEIEEQVSQGLVLDSTNEKALSAVGLSEFDWVVIGIGGVEESILTTLMAKELGAKRVIARAGSQPHAEILRKMGADKVIFPELEMGQRIADGLAAPKIFDYIELSQDYSIMELATPSTFAGKTIMETDARAKFGVHIIAVKRNAYKKVEGGESRLEEETLLAPTADFVILEQDTLVLLGRNEDLEKIQKL